MKERRVYKVIVYIIIGVCLFSFASCNKKKSKKFLIGVSQCSEDVWREKLMREMKTAEYFNDDIEIVCKSTDNNNKVQVAQIDSLVDMNVDLLIVSPNQQDITPVIDKVYDSGIPVILFDRKTSSDKYTAFIGGDNYIIGKSMAQFIATQLGGKGKVAEISGLQGSSPAIDRHRGFEDEMKKHPGITIVDQKWSNWEEDGGMEAMYEILERHQDIDYVFVQNDRMANGVSEVINEKGLKGKIKITGVDGLATKNGGMEQVKKGNFIATYIYPTEGGRVIELAYKILNHEEFDREVPFTSSIVTKKNADILYMQAVDAMNQSENLQKLHGKVDVYMNQLNSQRIGLYMTIIIIIIVLLIMVMTLGMRIFVNRQKMQKERARMKDKQLKFFTNVSHQIRTPLTLIVDPIRHIAERGYLKDKDLDTLKATHKNASELMKLVENILDFKDAEFDEAGNRIDNQGMVDDYNAAKMMQQMAEENSEEEVEDDGRNVILIVDDNADIRSYVKSIFSDKYRVLTAHHGKEGLKIAREKVPDVIISDIMMPEMDGLEMTRQIKKDMSICHIPVILLTAKSQQEQIVQGYASGADEYLTKPFNSKVIVAKVDNMMQNKERMQHRLWEIYTQQLNAHDAPVESFKQEVMPVADMPSEKNEDDNQNVTHISSKDEAFLEKLNEFIEQNLGDSNVNVESMGAEVGLSRVQLYRKVKALTGMSPVELLRKARLAHAKRMLETSDMSISEVCYNVGFSAPSYFTKCYKEEYGVTPSSK